MEDNFNDNSSILSLLKDSESISGDKIFFSLSPGASYAFEKFKIPYKTIRDYGGGEGRYQQGLENFQRIDRLVTIIDKKLAHLYNIPTLTPAQYSIYFIKILFDVLWNTILLFKRIIETEQPDLIRFYATSRKMSRDCIFSPDESFYTEILDMAGWNVSIEIIYYTHPHIQNQKTKDQKNTIATRLQTWIKEKDLFINLGLLIQKKGLIAPGILFYYYLTCWNRKPVLIYESGYNWDDALEEFYKEGLFPVYRIKDENLDKAPNVNRNYIDDVHKICYEQPQMREFDQILGIDVSGLFFEWLSHIIGRSIQDSVTTYPIAHRIIHQKKIHCVLHSVRSRATGHALIQAAHDAGIPVVSWQHGGAGYYFHPIMPFIEFINSDEHFVFGKGVAESYRITSERMRLEKIPVFFPVGSSSLDTFHQDEKRSSLKQTKKPIVYISTAYLRNLFVISQPCDPAEYDVYLWEMQKQILNLAKKNPNKDFIIKLHPVQNHCEPLFSYISDNGIKNVKIYTSQKTLRQLTNDADVVIFDLISTGILQVLTTNLPVFIYTGLQEIEPGIITQLKKRAYVYGNLGELITNIDQYINTKHVIQSSVNYANKDFLEKYGTDICTHHSAVRAVAKLKKIISERGGW